MWVENFVVKCRAYPNKIQKQKIDEILYGCQVAYNVTAYETIHENPLITQKSEKDESIWPKFSLCSNKKWLDYLRENYPSIRCLPSPALSSNVYSIFKDMEKSWANFHPEIIGKQKIKRGKPCFHRDGTPVWERTKEPVKLPCNKWRPTYYSKKKPRESFTVQTRTTGFKFLENSKTIYVGVTKVGKVKVRGWRHDIEFGEDNNRCSCAEFFTKRENSEKVFGVTVSKDNCGDYWIVVKLQTVWLPDKECEDKKPIGVDVGIKDIAITSEGKKYENRHFKKINAEHEKILNRRLSRRHGWKNINFREAYKTDKTLKPSRTYERTSLKLAKLERKIARKRDDYNNNVTADIIRCASFIGIESLNVKGMMANKHLSGALADAAMYSVLSKIKYKAERHNIPVQEIGRWEPSSKTCSVCGYIYKNMTLSVREWTCPECGTKHDRDINAAKNIKNIALNMNE